MTIWRMRIAYWIPKGTETHPEYVILVAFLLQQWLHERALVLRCTYFARLFYNTLHLVLWFPIVSFS